MELSNQHYLGNDGANPFYYCEPPLAYIDGTPIYEGSSTWLCCLLEDKENCDVDDIDYIPF